MSQRQRRTIIVLALGVFAVSVYLLASASPLLMIELTWMPGLPLGNLVFWTGIVSLPVISLLAFHNYLKQETRPGADFRLAAHDKKGVTEII